MNVLLLESITDPAYHWLANHAAIHKAEDPYSGSLISNKTAIDAIITRGKGDVNKDLITSCLPNLKVIARCGVGLDNINIAFASEQNIPVINLPASNADTVAEHAMSFILMLQRDLYRSVKEVKHNNWAYRNAYNGDEIRSKTLGIIGMGNIGQRLARLATAFGMHIKYWDKRKLDVLARTVEWEELIASSDIISLHLPLTNSTQNIINEDVINRMKTGVLIINTARGGLINMSDLKKGLDSGKIGGFAADVLDVEPPAPNTELLQLDNVIISPHAASLTKLTYNEMCLQSCKNAVTICTGGKIASKYIFNRSEI